MSYNGWKNYETWNVVLWINNDEGLYNIALESEDYNGFVETMREVFNSTETPDKVAWNDSGLDIEAINSVIAENKGEE